MFYLYPVRNLMSRNRIHSHAGAIQKSSFLIQHMQHYIQHDMQHSNPHTPHPQGLGWWWWWCPWGWVGWGLECCISCCASCCMCWIILLHTFLRCREFTLGTMDFLPDKKHLTWTSLKTSILILACPYVGWPPSEAIPQITSKSGSKKSRCFSL